MKPLFFLLFFCFAVFVNCRGPKLRIYDFQGEVISVYWGGPDYSHVPECLKMLEERKIHITLDSSARVLLCRGFLADVILVNQLCLPVRDDKQQLCGSLYQIISVLIPESEKLKNEYLEAVGFPIPSCQWHKPMTASVSYNRSGIFQIFTLLTAEEMCNETVVTED